MEILSPSEACRKWGVVLTGGIGSGKTTVAKILQNVGYPVINADQLSREIFLPGHQGYHSIVNLFGNDILDPSGVIQREKLRKKAFETPESKIQLESITHPLIAKELELKLKEKKLLQTPRIWFYEAPIIIEAGRHMKFLDIWLMVCPQYVRVKRIMQRDLIDENQAIKNIALQYSDNCKAKYASQILNTNSDLATLRYELLHALAYRIPGDLQPY
jgi:dephospho-CoA kinase